MNDENLTLAARFQRAVIAILTLGIAGFAAFWNPATQPLGRCLFHQWTGLSCLTCGFSRAVAAAARLKFDDAFRFHPFGILAWALLILVGVYALMETVEARRLSEKMPRLFGKILWILFLLWLGFGLGRLGWEFIQTL